MRTVEQDQNETTFFLSPREKNPSGLIRQSGAIKIQINFLCPALQTRHLSMGTKLEWGKLSAQDRLWVDGGQFNKFGFFRWVKLVWKDFVESFGWWLQIKFQYRRVFKEENFIKDAVFNRNFSNSWQLKVEFA